jgi:pimeloyl-ACP methyl ester carboxylesterase
MPHPCARAWRLLLALSWALAACGAATAAPPPLGPAFSDITTQCPWNLLEARASLPGFSLRCGLVRVPEFHAQPAGPQLRLAVLLAQRSPAHPTPSALLYLAGGPGNRAQPDALAAFAAARRDLVIFDQRGVGFSQPALNCPAVGGRDPLSAALQSAPALAACRDGLVRQGVHLGAYTIAEDAGDVDSLRQALGYAQLDLYAVSYGTQLALAALRAAPHTLRSLVLDSALPPSANVAADLPGGLARALHLSLAGCTADPVCGQTHQPNLENRFYALVAQLDAHPVTLSVNGGSVVLSGAGLAQLLLAILIQGPQQLPDLVDEAGAGDFTGLEQLLAGAQTPSTDTAWVMSFALVCSSANVGSAASVDAALALSGAVPVALRAPLRASAQAVVTLCDQWPAQRQPAASPFTSTVPTLVLAGAYDPITPPVYGQQVQRGLGQALYVEFPDRGHAVLRGDDCSGAIVNAFLQQPSAAPDTGCLARLRPFAPAPVASGKLGFVVSRADLLTAVAAAVHLSVPEVQAYLDAGHSLAELAAAQQVSRQQMRAVVLAALQKQIDAQLSAGALSASDAAQTEQKLAQGGVDQILDAGASP